MTWIKQSKTLDKWVLEEKDQEGKSHYDSEIIWGARGLQGEPCLDFQVVCEVSCG